MYGSQKWCHSRVYYCIVQYGLDLELLDLSAKKMPSTTAQLVTALFAHRRWEKGQKKGEKPGTIDDPEWGG